MPKDKPEDKPEDKEKPKNQIEYKYTSPEPRPIALYPGTKKRRKK